MGQNVSILVSIAAGVASFFSPCFLPLWPAYISFLAGSTDRFPSVRKAVPVAVSFVLGFTVLFTLLGASATLAGKFLIAHQNALRIAAGLTMILFGVSVAGLIRLPQRHKGLSLAHRLTQKGIAPAFAMGFVFAAGWTPCISPYLWPILAMAATKETIGRGTVLLVFYSFGLGIPFIATALLIERIRPFLSRTARHARPIAAVAGIILCATGILLILNRLSF